MYCYTCQQPVAFCGCETPDLPLVDLSALSSSLQLFECLTRLCDPLRPGPDVRVRGLAPDLYRFLLAKGLIAGPRPEPTTLGRAPWRRSWLAASTSLPCRPAGSVRW
jgi:hypothetical protein